MIHICSIYKFCMLKKKPGSLLFTVYEFKLTDKLIMENLSLNIEVNLVTALFWSP